MKKTRKRSTVIEILGIVILALVVCFLIKSSQGRVTTSRSIQAYPENSRASVSSQMHEIEPVVIKNVVEINGRKNRLLCTFQDREKAMQSVKKRDNELLQLMMKKWKVDELNSSNWKVYKHNLIPYTAGRLPDDLGGDQYENQHQEIEGFLAIYEDDEINQKTIKYIGLTNFLLETRLVPQVSLDPIIANFPFDAPIVEEAH
ncbi:hypothetical protein [Clostridium sp. KNHs216]|uniref:hypothetical protein n=1 Tax=Clostridium sp. KNHs216 TaxID=1550235 RepID=UPI001151AC84|nr:hypothetical protein [Clostridium sp. KNHs216]TQI67549.1 hypothetical protein LY85_2241 [Clostridium sp. KNHs216]